MAKVFLSSVHRQRWLSFMHEKKDKNKRRYNGARAARGGGSGDSREDIDRCPTHDMQEKGNCGYAELALCE